MLKDLTIGCDPEFGLMDGTRCVTADDYSDGFPEDCKVGVDGSGVPAEIRPDPSSSPIGLVTNIRNDLKHFASGSSDGVKGFGWKAGSLASTHPLGGHIHFGSAVLREKGERFHGAVTQVLDHTLACIVACVEDKEELYWRRMHGGYGRPGDRRIQNWGFEYRVLSSWLVSPSVAESVLSLAYILTAECGSPEFLGYMCSRPKLDFTKMDHMGLVEHAVDCFPLIQNLKLFPLYKKQVYLLYNLIASGKSWFPKQDMKTAWGCKGRSKEELNEFRELDQVIERTL